MGTPPNPSQTVPLTGWREDQIFKYMSLWGKEGFSFKLPQGTLGDSSPAGTLLLTLSQVAARIDF